MFIRHFPRERLSGARVAGGMLFRSDVRAAAEAYQNSPQGFEERDTLDKYVKQLTAALFPDPDAPRAPAAGGGHVHRPGSVRIPEVEPDREVFTADDLDEGSRSVGLLAWQEPAQDDFSHPYESARYVRFGSWQARHAARSSWRWTTREVRVATPNDLRRILPLLDLLAERRSADVSLVIWLSLVTGIQLKRLLGLRLLDEQAVADSLNEGAAPGDFPVYLCPERGMLFVAPAHDPAAPSRLVDDAVYRRRARLVPLWIGGADAATPRRPFPHGRTRTHTPSSPGRPA